MALKIESTAINNVNVLCLVNMSIECFRVKEDSLTYTSNKSILGCLYK